MDGVYDPLAGPSNLFANRVLLAAAWPFSVWRRPELCVVSLIPPRFIHPNLEMLQQDITTLSTPGSPLNVKGRALGHAHGLPGLFAVIPERLIYDSDDLHANVFDTAVGMLKKAANHDLGVAAVGVEVG
jgi:hypothetical protein